VDGFIAEPRIHGDSLTGFLFFFVSCARIIVAVMRIKAHKIIVLLCCVLVFYAQAGGYVPGSSSRRAVKAYNDAKEYFIKRDFAKALSYAQKAFSIDRLFTEAYLLGGDIASEIKNTQLAIELYEKAIAINPELYPPAFYILGNLYYYQGNYDKAIAYYRNYLGFGLPVREQKIVDMRLENALKAHELKNKPVPFDPVNLGDNINTVNDEYVNAVSADWSLLIFTVRSPHFETHSKKRFIEEFYSSEFIDGQWLAAKPLGFLPEKLESEGALSLSYDNRQIFFTSCHHPHGFGSCDLYLSVRTGKTWSEPKNLGPMVNSSRWESQPSLSPDGKILYFASNRTGGSGGSDLWKSVRNDDGTWSQAVNLGNVVNTSGDEMAPYMHADGQTMYFSSSGHPGLGGADLFISQLKPGGMWSKPVNLGFPINTIADEINLIVHPDGKRAYISSDMESGKGGYDIYEFNLYDAIKPFPVSYIKGRVRDAVTRKPLDANIELIELDNNTIAIYSQSDRLDGEFVAVLPGGTDYALNVNRPGYLFYSQHFALDTLKTGMLDPVLMDIYLKPIMPGQVVILKNVFFAHDSYQLEPISEAELNRLYGLMNDNPEIALEVSGHTDNTGTSEYNLELSTKRANAVKDYLVSRGIAQKRIRHVGLGEKMPIATNETPEGRALNRRTEFRILKNKTD